MLLSRRVAHTMLEKVIILVQVHIIPASVHLYIVQLFEMHSTATWLQPGLSFVNETSPGFTTTNQPPAKAGYRVGVPPPKKNEILHVYENLNPTKKEVV